MAAQNELENIKHNRNRRENEELIATGILSLLNKGVSMDVIRYADIAREIAIDPITVRRHMSNGEFFARNYQRIAEDFYKEASSRPSPKLFVPVFFSCVSRYRVWFQIEALRKSYQLLNEITCTLYPIITVSWPNYSNRTALYRIICSEMFLAIDGLLVSNFSESDMSVEIICCCDLI